MAATMHRTPCEASPGNETLAADAPFQDTCNAASEDQEPRDITTDIDTCADGTAVQVLAQVW
jgi:hypothetical protein